MKTSMKKTVYILIFLMLLGSSINFGNITTKNSGIITGFVANGIVTKGKVIAYKEDGTIIGMDELIENSKYSIPRNNYEGKIQIIAYIYEYKDVTSESLNSVNSLVLHAISTVSNNDEIVNVSAVTEIVFKLLDLDENISIKKLSDDILNRVNNKVTYSLTSRIFNPTKQFISFLPCGSNNQNDTLDNRYGLVLNAISGDSDTNNLDDNKSVLSKINSTINDIVTLIRTDNLSHLDILIINGLIQSSCSLLECNRELVPLKGFIIENDEINK